MIVVCVFLCRSYNEVRITCSINLSGRASSSVDASVVEGDLQTTGCVNVRFFPHTKFTCVFHYLTISVVVPSKMGIAAAHWLRCCPTIRKVVGSIAADVNGNFIDIILPIALWPWVLLTL